MAIGINWKEIWKPVWDPVWQQEFVVEPPVIVPPTTGGGSSGGWGGVGYWPSEDTLRKQKEKELADRLEADDEEAIILAIAAWLMRDG